MWRWQGTPQNFFLAFIDELKKQIIIKKTVEVGQSKINNFNIYNVAFNKKKKKKKNTCTYHYWNLHDMIYSSWDTAKQTEIGNFSSFFSFHPPKNPKTQHFEKWKNLLELSFYTCAPKITMIWCTVPEIRSETDKNFVILGHLLLFNHSPQWSQISKYWKKWKKCLEILSFYT